MAQDAVVEVGIEDCAVITVVEDNLIEKAHAAGLGTLFGECGQDSHRQE